LGIVMGVSVSSLILQNALTAYLEQLVTGHNKSEVRIISSLVQVSRRSLHSLRLALMQVPLAFGSHAYRTPFRLFRHSLILRTPFFPLTALSSLTSTSPRNNHAS
jgi:hypothetical protein